MRKGMISLNDVDDRLRRLEILVATLAATQAAMLAVGGFLAVNLFQHIVGGG